MGTPQGLGIASSMHAPGLAEPSHPGTPLHEMHPSQLPTQDDIINNLVRSLVHSLVAQETAALNEEIGKLDRKSVV